MANNPILYNGALAGACGGSHSGRWISNPAAASYLGDRNAAIAFATTVDAAIPTDATVTSADGSLMAALCSGVLQSKAITGSVDSANIALALAALWAETRVGLVPAPEPATDVAWFSRGTGAQLKNLYERDQDVIWVTDFMTAAQQEDAFNGTFIFDHQPAIQEAIDYAVYKNTLGDIAGGPRVRLPGGLMRCDSPINLGYGVDPRSVILEGEGQRYGGTFSRAGSGTAILFNYINAPGIVVQGGYNVIIRGMTLYGGNSDTIFNLFQNPQQSDLLIANWFGPGVTNGRYTPYACIAIDPYSGPQPGAHYPDVPYPAFLGATAQYNKFLSSNVKVEDCTLWGWGVGLAQQPCNADGNGDYTKMERVTFQYCAYGYSWGNTQSRAPALIGCVFDAVHTALSTTVYGFQIGEPNVACYSTSWSRTVQIMDIPNLNYGQGPAFYSCFAEAIYKLGRVGQGAETAGGVTFENCQWGFSLWDSYGVPVYTLENRGVSLIKFSEVLFYITTPAVWGALAFYAEPQASSNEPGRGYSFKGCTVAQGVPPTQRWEQCALNATQGITVNGAATYFEDCSIRAPNIFNLDTATTLGSFLLNERNQGDRTRCLFAYSKKAKGFSNNVDSGIDVAFGTHTINANGAGGVTTQVGRNITFTFTGVDSDYLSWSGGDVGDVLIESVTGAVFWVYSRTATVISARAMNGFNAAGNLLTAIGLNATYATINCRRYMPGPDIALYGDITAASSVIANMVDGDNNAAATLTSYLTIGDWIFGNDQVDRLVYPFGGNNRIGAIDNGAHTVTMLGTFDQTRTHMRMPTFIRPAMPNGTATP